MNCTSGLSRFYVCNCCGDKIGGDGGLVEYEIYLDKKVCVKCWGQSCWICGELGSFFLHPRNSDITLCEDCCGDYSMNRRANRRDTRVRKRRQRQLRQLRRQQQRKQERWR